MTEQAPRRPTQPILDAEAQAKSGDFSGVSTILGGLSDGNQDVRLRSAYVAGRIGLPQAIEPLSVMALRDRVSDNRNQAIFALVAIGRPAAVPTLIGALHDEEVERRMDARIGLYRMLGPDVFAPLVEEDADEGPDQAEIDRVTAWWDARAAQFDAGKVYAFGVLATPEVFILQASAATATPDAYFHALTDWTGQDFGERPATAVLRKWMAWWSAHEREYEPGRRYFFGRLVP
jgi:hypothetical protein